MLFDLPHRRQMRPKQVGDGVRRLDVRLMADPWKNVQLRLRYAFGDNPRLVRPVRAIAH